MTQKGLLGTGTRLVVKIGSALLIEAGEATPRLGWMHAFAADLARVAQMGVRPIIVSSGAIALGRRLLGLTAPEGAWRKLRLDEAQASAATGQIQLANAWFGALAAHDLTAAQILLTLDDTENRRRHLNARATIEQLLRLGAVPVVNENDTVATQEIRFGDNDRLAARVAQMTGSELLILLSDVDGLYEGDPDLQPSARHIPLVEQWDDSFFAMTGEARPGFSSGGMMTKLKAARICMRSGCDMIIAEGRQTGALGRLLSGPESIRHTHFVSMTTPRAARKRWIAAGIVSMGVLVIDDGARAALQTGKSLLPAGILAITGKFGRGDFVTVRTRTGEEVARGLVSYDDEELRSIAGLRSERIESILGYHRGDAAIHRDDLAI